MKKIKKLIMFILIALIILNIVVGCKVKDHLLDDEENYEEISMTVEGKDYDILYRSENISNLVVDLYGIDNASSIIFNDMVVIAVEMAVDSTFTDDVKEMIIDVVLANDTMIRQVLITEDKKIFEQIENIISSLMNGKPYDNYVKEINRLIEKLKKE